MLLPFNSTMSQETHSTASEDLEWLIVAAVTWQQVQPVLKPYDCCPS